MAPKSVVNVGDRYGRLVVIQRLPSQGGKTIWRCQCDCGNVSTHRSANMTNGQVTSCGCYKLEQISKAKKIHGHGHPARQTRTYRTWISMRNRCSDPKRHNAKNYIEKGITVCDRWQNSFVAFLEDMGERPEGRTLDRIDGNLGYSPDNCRWATPKEQGSNRSRPIRRAA